MSGSSYLFSWLRKSLFLCRNTRSTVFPKYLPVPRSTDSLFFFFLKDELDFSLVSHFLARSRSPSMILLLIRIKIYRISLYTRCWLATNCGAMPDRAFTICRIMFGSNSNCYASTYKTGTSRHLPMTISLPEPDIPQRPRFANSFFVQMPMTGY